MAGYRKYGYYVPRPAPEPRGATWLEGVLAVVVLALPFVVVALIEMLWG